MTFVKAAGTALGDSRLRRNLRDATETIRAKRAAAVRELPDWHELRAAGAQAKDRALSELDEQLIRLSRAVEAAGGNVHWARDAEEANRIVAALARHHGIEELVKVKSITTDEIGLNDALARVGVHAIETDLAELILQLSDDSSSHILVPAIHRSRTEIRDIFRRTIGPADVSDDPGSLCEAARTHLRSRFLSARMAVSGANFAVAGTGAVCVVESEGNGRMCVTLPEVLVTVMGIEKVIPEWRDMEVFLQLLPRSSTGERMNPYTSLWTGVRANDGPHEFHLVLLDNGRTNALADAVGRQALRCIRCSACLNSCPVYSRTGGHAYESIYPGPIGAILSPQLFGLERSGSLPYASTLCGACYEVCPVGIDIPRVLVHLRSRVVEQGSAANAETLSMRALARAFSTRRRYEALQRAGRLSGRILVRDGRIGRLPGPLSAWTEVRDFPTPPDQTFREWWHDRGTTGAGETRRVAEAWQPPTAERRGSSASLTGARLGPTRAGSSDARSAILMRIREGLGPAAPAPAIERRYRQRSQRGRAELVDEFAERLTEYGAAVRRAGSGQLARVLTTLCASKPAERLVVPPDLPADYRPYGIELIPDWGLSVTELGKACGALTGCALAVAQTGTIVLDTGFAQGRRALTLLPDYHLCVVREDQIVGLVPEAIETLDASAREGRPLTFISGPSATSDIELSRVEGVHGPRTLHVVISCATESPR